VDVFDTALAETVEQAGELHRLLSKNLSPEGFDVPSCPESDIRRVIGHSFTRMGLSHLGGIILLAREKAYIPCLALFRPMIEAHVRGLWLCFVAPANEATRFVNNPAKFEFPYFRSMLKAIAETHAVLSETTLTPGEWKQLCDYTHGGVALIQQVVLIETRSRRFALEMLEAIRKATIASGVATYFFVEQAGRKKDAKEFAAAVLRAYLNLEDAHRRLVSQLSKVIADEERQEQFESEVESTQRKRDLRRRERYVENPFA